jgi:hypothetical protein
MIKGWNINHTWLKINNTGEDFECQDKEFIYNGLGHKELLRIFEQGQNRK